MAVRDTISYRKYWLRFIVLCLFSCTACEEYFLPELDEFDRVLIVDGAITDMPGTYAINLFFSSGIFADDQRAIENATVTIIEEDGTQEILTEKEPGVYTTAPDGIQGVAGKNYKISIQLQDKTQYESPYQQLPTTIPINSVGADTVSNYLSIEEPDVPGYQFHVTTGLAEKSENYLLWLLEATYKYRADYTINYLYFDRRIEAYPNPTEFMTCWRTDQINEVFTFNTAALSEPKVEELPLHFARADQREISIRYSLLVKQFTISEAAFTFWNNLQRQIESQANLYNTQPFQVRGNIANINDPDEVVLGYFMVAGQAQKRIFIDRPTSLKTPFTYCSPDYMSYFSIGLIHPSNWPIYIYEDIEGERALANDRCFDCRELGGSTVKPLFWED